MGAPQETAYFRFNRHGKPYLVRRVRVGKDRKEQWIPLDQIDRETLVEALKIKDEVKAQTVMVPCTNPNCKELIPMTKGQLEEFFISSKKRYDMIIFPFHSTKCRDEMLALHGGAIPGRDQS